MVRRAGPVAVIIILLFAVATSHAQRDDVYVPEELEPWQDWVLRGKEYLRCPFIFDRATQERGDFVCAWPARLSVDIGTSGGRFSQQWTLYAEDQWIALPGNTNVWPQAVTVDGNRRTVVLRDGVPSVRLPPGRHTLSGSFAWDERPRTLAVPPQSGPIALTVDGERIARPQRNRNTVWLGEQREEKKVEDAMKVDVYRLLADDVPMRLTTVIKLEVAGSVREELLGPMLPDGFVPLSIGSGLPARLEPDGNLRLQVRPGTWEINLRARGPGIVASVALPQPEHNLPATEIWSFRSNDMLRVTVPEALRPVDPNQVAVPERWRELPGFRIEPGESLSIAERSRGKVETDNVLTLNRVLWKDFAGEGFVFADNLSGTMRSDWRMDMAAPYALMSAAEAGENLLITEHEGNAGVELRQAAVNLQALGRVDEDGALPVSGWQSRFETVTAQLNLPPGQKLLAARGVDRAPQSWLSRWKLLDFFLLLIITIAAARLFGRAAGAVAFVALALSFHEAAAPVWTWLNLLIAVALVRVAPEGRLLRSVKSYRIVSFAVLLLLLIPFAVGQIRIALYPQLESEYSAGLFGVFDRDVRPFAAGEPQRRATLDMPQAEVAAAPTMESGRAMDMVEEIVVTAAKQSYSRYAANALVQTGPGRPSWSWNSYWLSWSGPVDVDRDMRLIVLPGWFVSLLRIVAAAALGVFAALFAFDIIGRTWRWQLPGRHPSAAAVALAIFLGGGFAADQSALADTPSPEILRQLEERLLEPPDCVPRCAEVVEATADVGEQSLTIAMTVHAMEDVAVPLPGSANGWRPERITIAGSPASTVYRDDNGVLWLRLTAGRHALSLRGPIPPVDSLEIPFAAVPRVMSAESEHWFIAGIQNRRLVSGSLNLTRLRRSEDGDSSARWESSRFPVFVRIERTVELDLDWRVRTQVHRVAPRQGALSIEVPLLEGEAIVSGEFTVADGNVLVSMNPAQQTVAWTSTLPRESALSLTTQTDRPWKEVWAFAIGSVWNVAFNGVPESQSETDGVGVRRAVFYPRAGESLSVGVVRPEALGGSTLAFDQVSLRTSVGARSRSSWLTLRYRSTRGAQHDIGLPANSDVTSVAIDGAKEPLRTVDDKLSLPILPGEHTVLIEWQNAAEPGVAERTPNVELGAPSSNIDIRLEVPANRWILFTGGPAMGPAVLYWSELVALIVLGLILGRIGLTPLKTAHWILLGLGFSTFSWPALMLVAVWLLAHGARAKMGLAKLSWWRFNLTQVVYALLSLVALLSIVTSLPQGLLGSPDMHVRGFGSFGNALNWFADRSDSLTPQAVAWSVPLWIYKVLILAWALWLSFALVRWLPWVWNAFTDDGLWRGRVSRAAAKEPSS